jgi:D-serine deaminase-like pyridoxal phosphate-dependent protein
MPLAQPSTASSIATPYVAVDASRVHSNIQRAQAAAEACSARLRPHIKTHRVLWIARRQLAAGAFGLCCATVAQLEAVRELTEQALVSSPVQVDAANWCAIRSISRPGFLFSAASESSLRALRSALGPQLEAQLLLDVDVGCDRGGLNPEECGAMAYKARNLGLEVVGALGYPGQGYTPGRQAEAASTERDLLERAGVDLQRAGFDVQHLSAGSTPTMPYMRAGCATEFRPGTYIFGDVQQIVLGAIQSRDVALHVIATVLAQRDGQVVLDAGAKVLGRDHPDWLAGHGLLADYPGTTISKLYDHHAVVTQEHGSPSFRVGERIRVIPNNVNSAMALRRRIWLAEDYSTMQPVDVICED